MTTLNELLGSYDNLDEPIPWMNQKSSIYGLVISCLIITTICVVLRLYVRFVVTRTPGYDDYFVIATFITAWAANVGCLLLPSNGLGQHFILLGLTGMADFTRMFWWCNAVYNMTLTLVKLSLLFQYLRLINELRGPTTTDYGSGLGSTRQGGHSHPRLRALLITLIVIVALWGTVWTVVAWVPCAPISADWDFSSAPGADTATRWGYGSRDAAVFVATFYNHAAANMVLDILVISLPLLSRSLWATTAMERRSQLGMLGLFVLGALSVACSIVRFAYIIKTKATTYPTFDPTWYGTYSTVLSVVEVDLATVVASLPVFWPHLRRNIASILITHEIEVKVTRKSDFFLGGLGGGGGGSSGALKRNTRNVGAHWDVEVGGGGGGSGGGKNNGVRRSDRDDDSSGGIGGDSKNGGSRGVMMRDLGFGDESRGSGEGVALAEIRRPQRASMRLQPASRESMKEMLLN